MIAFLSYTFLTFYVQFCCIYYSPLLACPAYYKEKRRILCRIIGDAHVETLGADMTTHLATHAITTEIVGMTGMTNEETIGTMNTDITDVIGAIVIISGLGDN
jgi:hypothetical protein